MNQPLIAKLDDARDRADALELQLNNRYRTGSLEMGLKAAAVVGAPAALAAVLHLNSVEPLAILLGSSALVVALVLVFRRRHTGPVPESRAWEAEQSAALLEDCILEREKELRSDFDEELAREVLHLREQQIEKLDVAVSGDTRPGIGSFGVKPYKGRPTLTAT